MSQNPKPLYSHHIFIFPFKWDWEGDKIDFSQRTDLDLLQKRLGDHPLSSLPSSDLHWERFKFDWKRDYNEAIYFHSHVRDVLFDEGKDKCKTVLQYHIPGKEKALQYLIHFQVKPGTSPLFYTLEIEEITLNFYDTGIGIFAFHLNNYEQNTPDKVLKINDFGRRIYPQFLGTDPLRLEGPKGAFLADKIEILQNKTILATDDFTGITSQLPSVRASKTSFLIPKYIKSTLPRILDAKSGIVALSPLLDDRMHVICWVGDKKWLDDLGTFQHSQEAGAHWYSLIFVDGSIQSGIGNRQQALEYNRKHTYKRWADDGLYYGISRYSFVVLANEKDGFHRYVVLSHLQTIYFQVVLLSLLQRGSIVRFSEEITRLTQEVSSGVRLGRSSQSVKSLYAKYLEFVNKIYFREVTPQEQGIELYKMVQENMEIERDVKALQSEIQDFFNLLDLQATEQQADALNTLTIVGSGLLIPSLILAYYGVSAFPEIADKVNFTYQWTPFIALVGMLVGLSGAWAWVRCRGEKPVIRWGVGLVIIAVILYIFWVVTKSPLTWYNDNI